jgi:aspartate aminotransferase
MLQDLEQMPPDPILGLSLAYAADPNPNKVDLGVGVYRDEQGRTPIMSAVKKAERDWCAAEETKAYTPQVGVAQFIDGVQTLLLGEGNSALVEDRARTLQCPGGSGALQVAARVLKRARDDVTIWLSDPSWPNHRPLLGSAGVALQDYPYYDPTTHGVDFDAMTSALRKAQPGHAVLIHGCCHNPCGADLNQEQWRALTELLNERQLTPFIDIAYQGLGDGLDEDAFGVRYMAEHCPELIVASSASKNFGLYRERVGAVTIVTASGAQSERVRSHGTSVARGLYSLPPAHGGALVGRILQSPELTREWRQELGEVRDRINGMRAALAAALRETLNDGHFDFVTQHRGMFSFLGLSAEQVETLKQEHSIYMVSSSRVNVAGLTPANVPYVAKAIAAVL